MTSDCAFRLDSLELNVIESEKQADYGNLEVTPNGTFILSEYSDIYKLENSLSDIQIIKSPFEMDMIEFKSWNGNILEFECTEIANYERNELMELNTNDWQLHSRRLYKYKYSKCRGTTYFLGPRGGVFYFQNGKKRYV